MNRKLALITGAAGALGSELAVLAAKRGWETILVDRSLRLLDPVRDRIVRETGREPILHPLDLASLDPEACEAMAAAIGELGGCLDALVHCAASFDGLQPIDLIDPATWVRDFHVNVHAPWLLTARFMPLLRASGTARVIFLLDDLEKMKGPYWGSYGVGKWAIHALASQFSAQAKSGHVRVHAVETGPFRSGLRAKAYHSEDPQSLVSPATITGRLFDLMED